MIWDYPLTVTIDGEEFEIENKCDYRVILDCLTVYEDAELDLVSQHLSAMVIFYKEPVKVKNVEEAIKQMCRVIDCRMDDEMAETAHIEKEQPLRLMSWKKDFKFIAPAISRILGYDIRDPNRYTHWWSFMGAYMEIGECPWNTIITIRRKKMKGLKLEEWERKMYQENRADIDLPRNLTNEEREWLDSDW
jgi:hypothetical protein